MQSHSFYSQMSKTLHCLGGASVATTDKLRLLPLRSLAAIQTSDIDLFLHKAVDRLLGNEPSFAELEESIKDGDLKIILDAFAWFFSQTSKYELEDDQIMEDLSSIGVPEGDCKKIATVALARRTDIEKAAVRQSSEISTAYLKAFDWKVHLSISSDRAASLNEPLALLQLRVARDSPLVSDDVIIELTRDDLATLIDSLTAANGALAELSA